MMQLFTATHESGIGPKLTSLPAVVRSALGVRADIPLGTVDVGS